MSVESSPKRSTPGSGPESIKIPKNERVEPVVNSREAIASNNDIRIRKLEQSVARVEESVLRTEKDIEILMTEIIGPNRALPQTNEIIAERNALDKIRKELENEAQYEEVLIRNKSLGQNDENEIRNAIKSIQSRARNNIDDKERIAVNAKKNVSIAEKVFPVTQYEKNDIISWIKKVSVEENKTINSKKAEELFNYIETQLNELGISSTLFFREPDDFFGSIARFERILIGLKNFIEYAEKKLPKGTKTEEKEQKIAEYLKILIVERGIRNFHRYSPEILLDQVLENEIDKPYIIFFAPGSDEVNAFETTKYEVQEMSDKLKKENIAVRIFEADAGFDFAKTVLELKAKYKKNKISGGVLSGHGAQWMIHLDPSNEEEYDLSSVNDGVHKEQIEKMIQSKSELLAALQDAFTEDATLILNSCNTNNTKQKNEDGSIRMRKDLTVAQWIAKALQIKVIAAENEIHQMKNFRFLTTTDGKLFKMDIDLINYPGDGTERNNATYINKYGKTILESEDLMTLRKAA